MNKVMGVVYKIYSYFIPSIVVIIYFCFGILRMILKKDVLLIQDSLAFCQMYEAIIGFCSILLGIYGFFIPIIIGKKEDDYVKKFWDLISKKEFIKDMKMVVFSGIITIIISSTLIISDILPDIMINILVCLWMWFLIFFSCISYRFINIFIKLIVGGEKEKKEKIKSLVTEEDKQKINERYKEFK